MSLLILQWLINSLSIVVAVKLINGLSFTGKWWHMLIIGALFGIVNSVIRPVIRFFAFPLIILTLGIFTLFINAAMLGLTAALSHTMHLGLFISGFRPAFWGALVISVASTFLSWLIGFRHLKKTSESDRTE